MKPEDIEKIKVYATLTNTLDKYVYLREDEKGKYIEYAFIEGAPHDNRCLSWYDSYQEKAYIRNGWVKDPNDEKDREYLNMIRRNIDKRVNELFRLSSYTCGYEEYPDSSLEEARESWAQYNPDEPFIPEDHICKVGCPAPKCRDTHCKYWTYEEPVKCACWILREINIPEEVYIPIDIAVKLFDKIIDVEKIKNYIIDRLMNERKQLPSIQKNWYCYALKDVLSFIASLENKKEVAK